MFRSDAENYSISRTDDLQKRNTVLVLVALALLAGSLPSLAASPTLLWTQRLPYPVQSLTSSEQGVALAGSQFSPFVTGLNVARGEILWQTETAAPLSTTPAVYQNSVLLVPHVPTLIALRLDTGAQRWTMGPRFPLSHRLALEVAPLTRASPLVYDKSVFTVTTTGVVSRVSMEGRLMATLDLSKSGRDSFRHRPAASGSTLYLASDQGRLWQLDTELSRAESQSLDSLEVQRLGVPFPVGRPPGFPSQYEAVAPPLVAGGRLFISTLGGDLFGVSLTQGTTWKVWLGNGISQFAPNGAALAQPVAVPGGRTALIATRHRLVCLETDSGRVRWWHDFPDPVYTNPVAFRDSVLLATGNPGTLRVLSLEDGQELASSALEANPTSGPLVSKDIILLGLANGSVLGFQLPPEPSSSKSDTDARTPP